ncbi:MAG: FAD-dependent oxidoreductase [Syntrophorhabdaceae bacterium]|nr:FAD-dependent oxidoreductase [Syntrophorhabdaceae bacterium]
MYAKKLEFYSETQGIIEWIDKKEAIIRGNIGGRRISSRILEEYIQHAVEDGARVLNIEPDGQHGIGGRIWPKGDPVKINVYGPVGQRCGGMGMSGTEIIIFGSASDDVGWLNCGAKITVLGDVTNGAFNAAAQGILYVQGSGGARCDTLTKHNPRFDPPQSWYFRDVGDSFAEFKAGGISVVCGVNPRNQDNVLGYRPCVGMVGGVIYFRGKIKGFSEKDVKLLDISEQDWQWLKTNMVPFLTAINRLSYYEELTSSQYDWKKLIPYTPEEKRSRQWFSISLTDFRRDSWEKEIGEGGLFAEYIDHSRWEVIPYIATGELRRVRPVWLNERYLPPCAYACPTHIPTHKRTRLIREGKLSEALELMLEYSPLPATVCGEICPNLCMDGCTRARHDRPLHIDRLGQLSLEMPAPKRAATTGKNIAVIGGGPAGMSVAWQLALKGHHVEIYEASGGLGGKIEQCIPRDRFSHEVLKKEVERFKQIGVDIHLHTRVTKEIFEEIHKGHDTVVIACGAHKPRTIEFPNSQYTVSAYDFLRDINAGKKPDLKGKKVVVIGAGNVGMDVASEAFLSGAESVTAIDIQRPAAFGKELDIAKKKGTQIIWPKTVERYEPEDKRIYFTDGTSLDTDYVVMAIGDMPLLDFIPHYIHSERGWLTVNEFYQTSDPKVYAIGDVTGLGLVTHAIGQGRVLAEHIHSKLTSAPYSYVKKDVIPYDRIKREYYEACLAGYDSPFSEADRCLSCGTCRDCGICEATCQWGAIARLEHADGTYEYVVDDTRCIGCGFCAGVCPCGVWEMREN